LLSTRVMSPTERVAALAVMAVCAWVTAAPARAQVLTGVEDALFNSPMPATNQIFGAAVAITPDGSRLAVSAPREGSVGTVRIYVPSGTAWTLEATLMDTTSFTSAGGAIAITPDGTRVVVGAPTGNRAIVYLRTGATWAIEARLIGTGGRFGTSVAVTELGDRILIGAPAETSGGISVRGVGHVYVRSGSTWTEEAAITGTATRRTEYGSSVALSSAGDRAVLGGPYDGRTSILVRSGTAWTEEQAFQIRTAPFDDDRFGRSVSMTADGTRVVIGAHSSSDAAIAGGSAHVYLRTGTTWAPETTLRAPRGDGSDFARTVAISRDGAFILCDMLRNVQAFVFGRSGTTWSPHAALDVPGTTTDTLSASAAMVDDASRVIIGMPEDYVPLLLFSAGAVHTFHFTPATAQGGACVWDTSCGSWFCTDGVCCDSACNSGVAECQTCAGTGVCRPEPSGTVCRMGYETCDVSEICDGVARTCPVDAYVAAGTACSAAAGPCDVADVCTGTNRSCPTTFVAAGTECRAAIDLCDAPESCNGFAAACPADALAVAGTECRASGAICDPAETCDGVGSSCPADVMACPDAGTDAGTDAAIDVDASVVLDDAGMDAGVIADDAGPTDGGSIAHDDAAPHDGGPSDGSRVDAGARDASSEVDAGAPAMAAGCACRASGSRSMGGVWLLLAALGLVVARRRSRSRARRGASA
jgi:hypothetical protein